MKIRIRNNLRMTMMIAIVAMFCILALTLLNELSRQEFVEEKVNIYAYSQKAEIDYDVFLRQNLLHDEKSLEKGGTYITALIDYVDASMTYGFSGERNAEFKGEYEIIAEVEGYTSVNDEHKTIWKKDFILKQKTAFDGSGRNIEIKEQVPLSLSVYNDFVDRIREETGIISSAKLTLLWNVNVQAVTDSGTISEEMVSSAIIPLDEKYFEIVGQLEPIESGNIEETRKVQLPPDGKLTYAYGLGMGILAIAFILMLVFTVAGTKDPIEKRLKKIFRMHKERLAALSGEVSVEEGKGSIVKSIDDLVRIADELGKPIMYRYSEDFREMTKFYVFEENQTYIFDIEEAIADDDNDEKKDKNEKDKRFRDKKGELLNKTMESKYEPGDE